jgi:hypothetical protein
MPHSNHHKFLSKFHNKILKINSIYQYRPRTAKTGADTTGKIISPFGHDFSALQQRCVASMGQHLEAIRDTVCAITTKLQ